MAFGLAIFTSAFLLFQVQPLIGKFILPWFGGGPGVWTICMLFFQAFLLGGYAYAHWSVRNLRPQAQAAVHLLLLGLAMLWLPIIPDPSWKPVTADYPAWRILALLTACLGPPYLVLAATGPLLQAWFSRINSGALPYRLYAVSNAGSLLALLSYPFVIEPAFSRQTQARIWSWGLGGFAILGTICAWRLWQSAASQTSVAAGLSNPAEAPNSEPASSGSSFSAGRKWLWVAWPACASALLLATTNKICQDVSVIPFLWVLPLALYLLSFILCFDHPRWYRRSWFAWAFWPTLASACFALFKSIDLPLPIQIVIYSGTLFVCCMICHGELYRLKPPPIALTQYYLLIATGGAMGGLFVSLIAPALFNNYLELHLSWWLCAVLLGWMHWHERLAWQFLTKSVPIWILTAVGILGLSVFLAREISFASRQVMAMSRNFYGVLRVLEYPQKNHDLDYRMLLCGEICHGIQFLHPDLAMIPTGYYYEQSGIGLAFRNLRSQDPRRVGIVGLGIGGLSAYGRAGDLFRFYEINPEVERLARTYFSYLSGAKARVEVVLGDARLSLERETPQEYTLLILDAFNGDAIPVHLLSREAIQLYLRHLKTEGVLAFNATNRHLDIWPVLIQLARHYSLAVSLVEVKRNPREGVFYATRWVLMTRDSALLEQPAIRQASTNPPVTATRLQLWTDEYASLLPILKLNREPRD